MFDGYFQAGFHQRRGCSKNQVISISYSLIQQFFGIFFGCIIIAGGANLISECLFQVHTTQFMGISPSGSFGCLFMDKCHMLLWCADRNQPGKNIFLHFGILSRIHLQFQGVIRD